MDRIIVLDFGGQYCHLIARRVRQLHVYAEIKDPTVSLDELNDAKGIILSGGPSSVFAANAPAYNKELFSLKVPILGLCYGHQLIAHVLGGKVGKGKVREYGIAELSVGKQDTILKGLGKKETVWLSHFDTVEKTPPGFSVIASTEHCPICVMGNDTAKRYGIQFHPEVTHTTHGMQVLKNFVFDICGCKKEWDMHNYADQICQEIQQTVGERKVFMLVSGGVDSTVALALLDRALGAKRVYGLTVDHGFMRKDEAKEVSAALKAAGYANLHLVDASERFFKALAGAVDPEEKRKIIGDTFLEIFTAKQKELGLNPKEWMLGQGTIYPDTIETGGTKHADKIKTHHNRVDAVQKMIDAGLVVEPLKLLYKDEVRVLGEELGLPHDLVWRHPFPGPGLAIRALCSEEPYLPPNADVIVDQAQGIVRKYGLTASLLPVRSVGVQGDERSYKNPLLLVGSTDWKTLEKVSTLLTNSIAAINRVVWQVSPAKKCDFTVKPAHLTKSRIALLQNADAVTMQALADHNLMREIWQCPTVLVPLVVEGKESVVLRPVYSKEAMTAKFGEIPMTVLQSIAKRMHELGLGTVMYDVTHKPPGTIEWE